MGVCNGPFSLELRYYHLKYWGKVACYKCEKKLEVEDVVCSRFRGRKDSNPSSTVLYCEDCSKELYFM